MPRGKTFTGCWTCRDRRLKCDEVRPTCNKCSSKGLVCAGYDNRLHWLEPDNPESSGDSRTTPEKGVQRRLLPANGIERLSDAQVDLLLSKVDEDGARGLHCFHGPFGILSWTGYGTKILKSALDTTNILDAEDLAAVLVAGFPPRCFPDTSKPNLPENRRSQRIQTIGNTRAVTNGNETGSSPTARRQDTSPLNTTSVSHLSPTSSASHISPVVGATPSSTLASGEIWSESIQFLTAEVKFLLNHYRANVLPFFSVMDNMHTPWRVLHFPKALQAACEKELGDPTTGASSILLYTILTTSAYSLQNSEKKRRNRRSSHHWEEVATRYKGEALNLLQTYIGNLCNDRAESDYHELLAAILSMVTIDVMCGDTRTCEVHLQACETLIETYMNANTDTLSPISKALHTTFIYLRVMQEATSAASRPSLAKVQSPQSCETSGGASDLDDSGPKNNYVAFVELGEADDVSFTSFSSELIYGFPIHLLFLLRATIQIASYCDDSGYKPSPDLQIRIDAAREELEDDIMDWPVELVIAKYRLAPLKPGNVEIMDHYTRAFHQAIIIYFLDQVHHTRPRLLQPYVQSVIFNLERAEMAKKEHSIVAGPLLWPAFTAASHAIDPHLRDRFIKWLEGSDQMGVGTSKATVDLLKQIWSKAGSASSTIRQEAISRSRLVLT